MTDSGEKLPLGDPRLAWSFTGDGQIRRELLENRDRRMSIDTAEKRRERQDLASGAHPQ